MTSYFEISLRDMDRGWKFEKSNAIVAFVERKLEQTTRRQKVSILSSSVYAISVVFLMFILIQNCLALIRKAKKAVLEKTSLQKKGITSHVLMAFSSIVCLVAVLYEFMYVNTNPSTGILNLITCIAVIVAIGLNVWHRRMPKEKQDQLPKWLRVWMIE